MELIASTHCGGVYDSTGGAAEFGIVVARLDLELLERIWRRHHNIVRFVQQIGQIRVIIDTVEKEIVVKRTRAAGTETVAVRVAGSRLARGHAYGRLGKLHSIAPIERKAHHGLAVDDLAGL